MSNSLNKETDMPDLKYCVYVCVRFFVVKLYNPIQLWDTSDEDGIP